MDFQATCPTGLEALLAQELKRLGLRHVRPLQGMVTFSGEIGDGYRACLWSRIASRVVVVIGSFECDGRDSLYEQVHRIPWEDHLSCATTFAVFTTGAMEGLENSMYVSQLVKDAVVDRLFSVFGTRPDVDPSNPDLRLQVRLRPGHATVGIDLSGEPLFRRGYERERRGTTLPGLRPDYAAALLELASWGEVASGEAPALAVAFSGTGTLVVEGAAMALDVAPGLLRTHWGFERWEGRSEGSWHALLARARSRAERGASKELTLRSWDLRPQAASDTLASLRASGIPCELTCLTASQGSELGRGLGGNCLVASDLSWTHGDEAAREAEAMAGAATVSAALESPTPLAALTRDGAMDALLGLDPTVVVDSRMGTSDVHLRLYPDGSCEAASTCEVAEGREVALLVPTSDQFCARLRKDVETRRDWAESQDISCYRVYDRDLPDYNVAIDLYRGADRTPGRWLVVSEYAAPSTIDPEIARRRLLDVLNVAPAMTRVRSRDVFCKVRTRAKGGSQYVDPRAQVSGRAEGAGKVHGSGRRGEDGRQRRRFIDGVELPWGSQLVEEGGLTFEVRFEDHIDTGLFLDHRLVREELRELAKRTRGSKRFLNLFAYTGAGTVYAADGGALHTTTVDLSWNYIDWARRNMQRNGFDGEEHEYVRADVIGWIERERRSRDRWDLIYCDPPTFSNSKSMGRGSFDVQRDHVELLIGISRLLTRDGLCIFSCNLRDFEPDVAALDRAGVVIEDITEGTIPEDFSRNAKVHHVYSVTRRPFTAEELERIERNNRERRAAGRKVDERRGGLGSKAGGASATHRGRPAGPGRAKGPGRPGDRDRAKGRSDRPGGRAKGRPGTTGGPGGNGSASHRTGPWPKGRSDSHGGHGSDRPTGHGTPRGPKAKGGFDPHGHNRAAQGRKGANGPRTRGGDR